VGGRRGGGRRAQGAEAQGLEVLEQAGGVHVQRVARHQQQVVVVAAQARVRDGVGHGARGLVARAAAAAIGARAAAPVSRHARRATDCSSRLGPPAGRGQALGHLPVGPLRPGPRPG